MSGKNKKQFGVWMDAHHATVVGKEDNEQGAFVLLGHVKNAGADNNSNENAANNHENSQTQKFFKAIALLMPNIEEIHITGTGQVQEQFIKFLSETAQYKNAVATESTSNKMDYDGLSAYITEHFK